MFTCLQIRRRDSAGIFHRVFNTLTGQKTELLFQTVCGVEYRLLRVHTSRDTLDWAEIGRSAGRFPEHMLLPDSLAAPDFGSRFCCDLFDRQVLLHTACELINRTKMPMYRRVLGMVDRTGKYADFLFELLKYYTAVKVVTDTGGVYADAARDMMERLGAPVLVGSELESLAECVLILAPEPLELSDRFSPACPVLAGGDFMNAPAGWDTFSSLKVQLPDNLLPQVPEGIDSHLFAGALYEIHDVLAAGLTAGRLMYNCRSASLAEAVEIVSRRVGANARF